MVSFGLTAILFAVPFAYSVLKAVGVLYLLHLAFQAIKPNGGNIFENNNKLSVDKPQKLFTIGFLTSVLNPKMAVFYLSFFPQFISPKYGSILTQSLQLGMIQIFVSFMVNLIIVLTASKISTFFSQNAKWLKIQKWFMSSVLAIMAIKMALSKAK
jgi:threonine/homoserine/homoserine lactone efflux protein